MTPTPTPPCLGEREAVARTIWLATIPFQQELLSCGGVTFMGLRNAATDAIIAQHIEPLRIDNETLRAERDAAIARAEEAYRRHEDRFWLELKEPRCVPQQSGPWPLSYLTKVLRECMAARPQAYITVVTIGSSGPMLRHGPEVLQMADARSMGRGQKHNKQSNDAHGQHLDAVLAAHQAALAECDAATAKLAQAEGKIATMRGALETIAEEHDAGRHDGLPEACPAHEAEVMWAVARAALTTPEPPHGD